MRNEAGNVSIKEKTYETIKQRILTCEYAPGTWLDENSVCKELGVSRTPVRDALSRLEQDGLIKIHPKRGSYVTELSLNTFNSIHDIRLLAETFALRRYGSRLDEGELLRYLDEFTRLENQNSRDARAIYDLDDNFHLMIVNATQNTFLIKAYESIQYQYKRLSACFGQQQDRFQSLSYSEHCAIISSCLKHDWEQAAADMEKHLLRSRDSAFRLLLENQDLLQDMKSE